MAWVESFTLPLTGLAVLVILAGAVALGYYYKLRLRRHAEAQPGDAKSGPDHLLTAALGLLALLLGFSFSMSLIRYETRRDLVVQEANALGTTWLRIQLLNEPDRSGMSSVMKRYVDARLLWSENPAEEAAGAGAIALQDELWASMGKAFRGDSPALLTRGVMDALNQSLDLALNRQALRSAHIPDTVLVVLLLYMVLSMVMMGSVMAASRQPHRAETSLLLILLTLAYVVIIDLDRPRAGSIQVSQQPMEQVQASMSR